MKRILINQEETDYFITKEGKVYSEKVKRFLNGDKSSGYERVLICLRNGEHIRKAVHNLVAETYLPNINNLPIVHHKDGNRFNNNLSNLEWIAFSDNLKKENSKSYPKIKNSFSEEEIKNEEWRQFRDSFYYASNLGRLKNIKTNKIIEGHINYILGYMRDTLCLEKGRLTLPRHRIVYESFFPNEVLNTINHKDGIRFNNRLSNLENITSSENLRKSYVETKKRKTRKCLCYNQYEKLFFFSIAEASRHFNCNESQIRKAMNEKGSYKNYKIRELTEEEYNEILIEGSETIERIIKEKDFNE